MKKIRYFERCSEDYLTKTWMEKAILRGDKDGQWSFKMSKLPKE